MKTEVSFNVEAFTAWKTKCIALSDQLLPLQSRLSAYLEFKNMGFGKKDAIIAIGQLKGLQDVLAKDLLSDLGTRIEAEVASDYMGQAEGLLGEGITGRYDQVPAAVLAGAVLEKALKTLCALQSPPIPLEDHKGRSKMLNALIDDLKKTDLYHETKDKQLRAWAAIRNAAAHGEFEKFTREEVESMVKGISDFLGRYLP
jgi:hypothetical protein